MTRIPPTLPLPYSEYGSGSGPIISDAAPTSTARSIRRVFIFAAAVAVGAPIGFFVGALRPHSATNADPELPAYSVTNTGSEPLTGVTIRPSTALGKRLVCMFPDGTWGASWTGTLAPGETVRCDDAGGVTISDVLWNDANHNGVQDNGEKGIPGVVVRVSRVDGKPVTDVDGKPVTTVTHTDQNGRYTFANLGLTGPGGARYVISVSDTDR